MARRRPSFLALALVALAPAAVAEAPMEAPLPVAPPEQLRPMTPDRAGADGEAPEPEAPAAAPVPAESPASGGEPRPSAAGSARADAGGVEAVEGPETGGLPAAEGTAEGEPGVAGGPAEDEQDFAVCASELAALGVVHEPIAPITGEGICGAPQPIRLSEVRGVELRPAVEVRCPVALSLSLWIDRVVAPLADLYMEDSLHAVLTGTGYQCRRRRGDGTANWSEHAFANAIDISGLVLESGDVVAIEPRGGSAEPARSLQAGIRGGACAFFTTVLGPTTNASHADHLHLDMAERNGGYRLCE